MAAKARGKKKGEVVDYRHKTSSRLNIPPAGLAARGNIVREKKIEYAYNPHLSPSLRFDGTGGADRIAELLDAARKRPLTDDETKLLQEAFRHRRFSALPNARTCNVTCSPIPSTTTAKPSSSTDIPLTGQTA